MKLIDELRAEGFDVAGAMFLAPDPRPTVYAVRGHGIQVHVRKDDFGTLASLLETRRDRRRRRELAQRLVTALATKVAADG